MKKLEVLLLMSLLLCGCAMQPKEPEEQMPSKTEVEAEAEEQPEETMVPEVTEEIGRAHV